MAFACWCLCRQQKGSCRPVRVNGARDITRLMAQTAIQVTACATACIHFQISIHILPNDVLRVLCLLRGSLHDAGLDRQKE